MKPMARLCARCADPTEYREGHPADDAGRQTVLLKTLFRAGLWRLLGSDRLATPNCRAAAGCRQYGDACPLPRPALASRVVERAAKYAGQKIRQRASSPKLNAHNTALISALSGYTCADAGKDRSFWGGWWRARSALISSTRQPIFARSSTGVKARTKWISCSATAPACRNRSEGGTKYTTPKGLSVFAGKFKDVRPLIVGEGGVSLAEFRLPGGTLAGVGKCS